MMIANTRTIVEGLGGKYTPFQAKIAKKTNYKSFTTKDASVATINNS